jgi:hypothetical protein
MKFQAFDGIRLENFSFKLILRHFHEAGRAKTLPDFCFKHFLDSMKQQKRLDQGLFPFFFASNLHK